MVKVFPLDLLSFFHREILDSLFRLPVVFHENCFTFSIYPFICVHSGTLPHAVIGWNSPGRINKSHHMERFRRVRTEIKETLTVLNVGHRVWAECVDHIRELHRISDEKYFDMISD